MIPKRCVQMLETFGVGLWWADELWRPGGKRRAGWSGVADVACSKSYLSISVPRHKGAQLAGNITHEVAHLLRWAQTGKYPHQQKEIEVCADAMVLAREFRLSPGTLEYLEADLTRELERGDR